MRKGSRRAFPLGSSQINATRLNYVESRLLKKNLHQLENNFRGELSRLERQSQDLRFHYTNVVRVVKQNRAYEIWKQANIRNFVQERNKNSTIRLNKEEPRETENRPLLLLVKPPKQEIFIEKEINFEEEVLRPSTTSTEHRRHQSFRTNPLIHVLSRPSVSREQTSELEPFHRIASQNQTALRTVERKFNEKSFAVQHRSMLGPVRSSTLISISNVSSC